MSKTSLEDVVRILARWRAAKRSGDRLPEELWDLVVNACADHPVSLVAKRLSLDYYQVKNRLASAPQVSLTCSKIVSMALPQTQFYHPQESNRSSPLCELSLPSGVIARFYEDCESLRSVLHGRQH